eukprot:NODE_796_length_4178_cov_0.311351.p1 type:complete len:502 gc:universal NODE_796_length_4178_cov_0.311351:4105-2600(-)
MSPMFLGISFLVLAFAILFYMQLSRPVPDIPNFSQFYNLNASDVLDVKNFIKNMTSHAASGYLNYGFPMDILDPINGKGISWSYSSPTTLLTVFDMLDTLYLMNLPQYQIAKSFVSDFQFSGHVNSFEFVAKVLGGLISMYDLTNEDMYLRKARYLGTVLSNYTGLAPRLVDLSSNKSYTQDLMSLSFIGSRQLEMSRLSQITLNKSFYDKAIECYDIIFGNELEYPGLFPSTIDKNGKLYFHESYGAGPGVDSFYEYLLKVGIHRADSNLLSRANISLNAIMTLLSRHDSGYTFVASDVRINMGERGVLDHYTCFLGGLYALASTVYANTSYLQFAEEIAHGCWKNYLSNPAKLGPSQSAGFVPLMDEEYYRLGSELVETNFYLFRLTGNDTYQFRNLEIAKNIDRSCKTRYGYASINVITGEYLVSDESVWINTIKMIYYKTYKYAIGAHKWDLNNYASAGLESGFISKTLKYLYLTFDSQIDLRSFLFTTQGHLVKMS